MRPFLISRSIFHLSIITLFNCITFLNTDSHRDGKQDFEICAIIHRNRILWNCWKWGKLLSAGNLCFPFLPAHLPGRPDRRKASHSPDCRLSYLGSPAKQLPSGRLSGEFQWPRVSTLISFLHQWEALETASKSNLRLLIRIEK